MGPTLSSVCLALLLAVTGTAGAGSLVLLDEYWAPEISANDVRATEVDTQATGDKTQARFGEFSAQLCNRTGFPNVRFSPAASVRLDTLPLGGSEARLWYRTDHWSGTWALEVWVWHDALKEAPVRVLEAALDAGGADGSLIPDDQWHQAKGPLRAAGEHPQTPQDQPLMTYVWLRPTGGWNVAHRTFIDRAELIVLSEEKAGTPPPAPVVHVRPRPAAQINGGGWIWFEGEDAVKQNLRATGALLPGNAAEQSLLSNGAWLQDHQAAGMSLLWQVQVPQTGRYEFWCRAMGSPFKWAWDAGDWHEVDTSSPWQDEVVLRWHGQNPVSALWVKLGTVALSSGQHLLQIEEGRRPEGVALDCFLLTQTPFTPHGAQHPGPPATP